MKEMVERCLVTVGKDENQTGMVVFPYNEEDVLERFGQRQGQLRSKSRLMQVFVS